MCFGLRRDLRANTANYGRSRCASGIPKRNMVDSRYRSPGHHVEGGSAVVILVRRSATRWLRLYG